VQKTRATWLDAPLIAGFSARLRLPRRGMIFGLAVGRRGYRAGGVIHEYRLVAWFSAPAR
jgi:hypothetical protein